LGEPVALAAGCCGLPLLLAGDALGFARTAGAMARSLERYERVWIADAGCAMALARRYGGAGIALRPPVETLAEAAARRLPSLSPVIPEADAGANGPVRWHDPCQLGRGLGVYEAPRAVLTRALGQAPGELEERRERALCSGAGGLLPRTMPDAARRIADARLDAHRRAGGGRVVTACASSLLALRGRAAGVRVDDLVTWIARSAAPTVRSPPP
jgi:Fe-S oxidoreductase